MSTCNVLNVNTGPVFPLVSYESYLESKQITSPSSSFSSSPVALNLPLTVPFIIPVYLYSANLFSTEIESHYHQFQTPPAPIRYSRPSNGALRDPGSTLRLPWSTRLEFGLRNLTTTSITSNEQHQILLPFSSSSTTSFFSTSIRSLMTGFLLQLAAVHRCSTTLFTFFNETPVRVQCQLPPLSLTPVQNRVLVARAAVAATRLRRRRANANYRAPATHLQKRRKIKILDCHSFQKTFAFAFERRLLMARAPTSHQDIRHRPSAATADSTSETPISKAAAAASTLSKHAPLTRAHSGVTRAQKKPDNSAPRRQIHETKKDGTMSETMPSPPSRTQSFRGHSRSQSAACRQVNRLSLTLPIALPTSDPSRPTPTSSTAPSIPPTPIDSGITSPLDTNDFIIAIAAQERRVLELREELLRAEADLTQLKKQWSQEAPNKRGELRSAEPFQPASSSSDDETRRSVEMDRRKMMLQNQHSHTEKEAPTQNRRRVMRGGHTRTLSLLSPAKTDAGFSIHEELQNLHKQQQQEPVKLPPLERRTTQLAHQSLAKRASWQPRTQQNVPTYPQIVEDFKLGLRAFVEDIRQITVGDEPISGQQPTASSAIDYRNKNNNNSPKGSPSNQDTIKASQKPRPKVSNVFDSPSAASSSAKSIGKAKEALPEKEKPKAGKNKHFSWTPLGFDAVDDDDWSNWESPSSVKTSRWSGSTIGNGGIDDIQNIEESEEQTSPSKRKSILADAKLGEILPNMVNQLTPSNIKRTATNLMDEWEKSLTDPQTLPQNKENTV